jgi:hypothetical protein
LDRAAKAINDKLRDVEDKRDYDRSIPPGSLQRAILDDHYITYAHLNAVAKLYGIPVSLILAFTRVRDELESVEKRGELEALRVLSGMSAAIAHLSSRAREAAESKDDVLVHLGHDAFLIRDYSEAVLCMQYSQ